MTPPPKKDGPQGRSQDVTRMLVDWGRGNPEVLAELMPIVYDELRRLAEHYMRREHPGHTLQPTALVHEAFLRLVDQTKVEWQSRAQFFGIAANLMRQILVEHARRRRTLKRGGMEYKISLDELVDLGVEPDVDLVALDDALRDLSALDPQKSRVVELRFFAGLSLEETAEVLGRPRTTVFREWTLAKAWLLREIKRNE